MKSNLKTAYFAVCIFAGLMLAGSGCGQKAWNPFAQKSDQAANTSTDQDTATQGSQVYVYVVNAPGKDGLPQPGEFQAGTDDAEVATGATTDGVANEAGGNAVTSAKAGYVQAGLTINITTGGTAPSVTGSATGSAAQTPTGTATQTPTQHVDPRLSTSIPIAVAQPGSMIDQQATAATEGSTANPTKTSSNDLRYAELKAQADQQAQMLKQVLEFLNAGKPEPAAPTTQPAENDGASATTTESGADGEASETDGGDGAGD